MSFNQLRGMIKDRGAWRAAVHGVTRSRTRLSNLTTARCCKVGCQPVKRSGCCWDGLLRVAPLQLSPAEEQPSGAHGPAGSGCCQALTVCLSGGSAHFRVSDHPWSERVFLHLCASVSPSGECLFLSLPDFLWVVGLIVCCLLLFIYWGFCLFAIGGGRSLLPPDTFFLVAAMAPVSSARAAS